LERNERTRSIFTRFIDFCWSLIKWIVLVVIVAAAAGVALYHYRGQEMLRAMVQQRLAEGYENLLVSVESARIVGAEGLEIRGIRITDPSLVGPTAELLYVDELFVQCRAEVPDLLDQKLDVRRIDVRRPRLRCTRLTDGKWSSAALLPLPKLGDNSPTVIIEDGTVEIVERHPGEDPISLHCRDLQLTISAVEPEPGTVAWNPASKLLHIRGTVASEHFQELEMEGYVEPAGGRWTVEGTVQHVRVTPKLCTFVPKARLEPVAKFVPTQGRIDDLKFRVSSGQSADQPPVFSVNGRLSGGKVQYGDLPDPLTDVCARFSCSNEAAEISGFSARLGRAVLQGSLVTRGLTRASPFSLKATATGLQLDHRTPAAAPRFLQPIWDEYSPAGVVDAGLTLSFDGHKWRHDLTIHCRDVSMAYEKFLYRVHETTGTIRWRDEKLDVNLRTMAGNAPVRIVGEIFHPGPRGTGELLVQSDDWIPIDDDLIGALQRDAQKVVAPLRARGWVRFTAHMHRPSPAQKPSVHLLITLHDCSIVYKDFPYPIREIGGTLEMINRRWNFRELEGRNDSAYITGAGCWVPYETRGGELTLDLAASDIALKDELRDALGPAARDAWIALRPRGNLDHLTVGVRYGTKDKRLRVDVRAQKWPRTQSVEGRAITIDPEWFPYQLDQLTGTMHYRDGRIELQNMRAVHNRTAVAANGYCEFSNDGRWRLRFDDLTADRLEVDHDLIAALPPRLAGAVDRLQLEGPIAVSGALQLDGAESDPHQLVANWDLTFDIENGSLGCGVRFDHIFGGVRFVGASRGESFVSHGELAVDSLMWQGYQLTQIRGPLRLDPSELLCGAWAQQRQPHSPPQPPRGLTARLFGGKFEADAQVLFNNDGTFAIDARLSEADLAQLAMETMSRDHQISGKVFGAIRLSGNCHGTHSLRGQGSVRLRDADIYELPLMVALLKILSVRRPDKTAFTKSDIDFRVAGDHVYLDPLNFSGDAICLKGNGSVGLDGYIEKMEFYALVGPDSLRPSILTPVLGEASRQLLVIRVAGPLGNPQLTRDALPAFKETVQQLFPELAQRRKENHQLLPTPKDLLQGKIIPPAFRR
jgi:hypothetical protein